MVGLLHTKLLGTICQSFFLFFQFCSCWWAVKLNQFTHVWLGWITLSFCVLGNIRDAADQGKDGDWTFAGIMAGYFAVDSFFLLRSVLSFPVKQERAWKFKTTLTVVVEVHVAWESSYFFFSSESIIIIIARDSLISVFIHKERTTESKFFQFINDDIFSCFYNLNPFEQENIVNTLTNTNFISLIQWNQWSCEHDTRYFSYWVISPVST